MNKGDYLSALHRHLADMPKDERDSAMRFYMEYFDDAGAENEQSMMLQLGTPRQLADQLLAEMGTGRRPTAQSEAASAPKRSWSWWMWVLIVFASPILAGLAAGALGLLIGALAVVLSALLVALIAAFIPQLLSAALVLGGIFTAGNGALMLLRDFPTALYFIGAGLAVAAAGALLFWPALRVLQRSSRWAFKFTGWLTRKMRRFRRREGGEGA